MQKSHARTQIKGIVLAGTWHRRTIGFGCQHAQVCDISCLSEKVTREGMCGTYSCGLHIIDTQRWRKRSTCGALVFLRICQHFTSSSPAVKK